MDNSKDLEKLLKLSKDMLLNQKSILSTKISELEKDDSIPKEQTEFLVSINSRVNDAINNGDSGSLNTILSELKLK